MFSSDFQVVFFSFHDNFILKAILYEEQRALGMMIESNSDERDTRAIYTLKRLTEIVVVVDLLSCGSIYTRRWINWYSYLLIGSLFFFVFIVIH